jgi:hypothetical protein
MGPGEGEPDIVSIRLDMYCTVLYTCTAFTRDASRSFIPPVMATPDSIAHVLASTLTPDSNVRIAAELNLSELLKSPRKLVWPLRLPFPLSLLDTTQRVGAFTCTTRALSRCRVLFTTDESYFVMRAYRMVLDDVVSLPCTFWTSTRRLSYSGST